MSTAPPNGQGFDNIPEFRVELHNDRSPNPYQIEIERDEQLAKLAGAVAFTGVFVGSLALSKEGAESYLAHYNTLNQLGSTNTRLHDLYVGVPTDSKYSLQKSAIESRIDTVKTEIAETKYNFNGGIHPQGAVLDGVFLGSLAAILAIRRYHQYGKRAAYQATRDM